MHERGGFLQKSVCFGFVRGQDKGCPSRCRSCSMEPCARSKACAPYFYLVPAARWVRVQHGLSKRVAIFDNMTSSLEELSQIRRAALTGAWMRAESCLGFGLNGTRVEREVGSFSYAHDCVSRKHRRVPQKREDLRKYLGNKKPHWSRIVLCLVITVTSKARKTGEEMEICLKGRDKEARVDLHPNVLPLSVG